MQTMGAFNIGQIARYMTNNGMDFIYTGRDEIMWVDGLGKAWIEDGEGREIMKVAVSNDACDAGHFDDALSLSKSFH